MAVHFKFKSAKDYDSIPIDGHFISVGNLKERIFESKLGRGKDFDLMVSNAQTDEEYAEEAMLIPRNTSVLIRRVPGRPRKPIIAQQDEPKVDDDKAVDVPQTKSSMSFADSSIMRNPEESEWDEFGNDLYAIPEALPVQSSNPVVSFPPPNKVDEDSKIKALIDTPALDWQRQTQEAYGPGRGFGRGMGGRMMAGRGFGRGGFERKTPPPGYICHRCKVPGHFIQHCPTNGDPNYDIKRVKPPTGIPKSMLMANPDGFYALPSGAVAVLKPNEAAFEKEIEGLPSTRLVTDLPPEFHCPLCKEVMKDAVLTSKCCFSSFCDKCIRDYIISKSMCICGATNILADDLLPNKTLRETISRILESTTSSAENAGSLFQVQDMESARPTQSKAPSPTLSATSKEELAIPPPIEHTHIKEGGDENEGKVPAVAEKFLEKKTAKTADLSEATPESMKAKEPTSQECAPVPEEEVQEKLPLGEQGKKKKKKKMHPPVSAVDMQWRAFQDGGAENFVGMPLAPSAYNPYFTGMPWGMDGYMAPFPGTSMPFMGYTPGPFDVPFGGVLPQDPFASQGYMMPVLPHRDFFELNMGGMNTNRVAPGMSREEIEARKASLRRKFEMERRNERERSKDNREIRRDMSGSAEISSLKSKHRSTAQETAISPQRPGPARMERARSSERHGSARIERAKSPSLARDRAARRPSPAARASKRMPDHDGVLPLPLPPPPPPPPVDANADRKHKGSVFSRISFPGSAAAGSGAGSGGEDKGSGKKRKSFEAPNGFRDHEPPPSSSGGGHAREERRPSAAVRSSSSAGAPPRSVYEHESSEEEHHFKRRPSSSRREAAERGEEGGRSSRGSRERERSSKRR